MQVLKILVLVLIIPTGLSLLTMHEVFQVLAFTDKSQNPIYAFSPVGYLLQVIPVVVALLAFLLGHKILTSKD